MSNVSRFKVSELIKEDYAAEFRARFDIIQNKASWIEGYLANNT